MLRARSGAAPGPVRGRGVPTRARGRRRASPTCSRCSASRWRRRPPRSACCAASRPRPGARRPRLQIAFRPIVAATDDEAWAKAHAIRARIDALRRRGRSGTLASAPRRPGRLPENTANLRLAELAAAGERHDRALWTPTVAGAGGLPTSATALVGSYRTVADALLDYVDLGFEIFGLRGYDLIEDAIEFGDHVIPLVHAGVARSGQPPDGPGLPWPDDHVDRRSRPAATALAGSGPGDVAAEVGAVAERAKVASRDARDGQPRDQGRGAARARGRARRGHRPRSSPRTPRTSRAAGRTGRRRACSTASRSTPERIVAIADALRELAALPDPVGEVVRGSTLPNGLRLRQVRVPMGVVGMIYEARPNVTVDAAGLALKSGNAVILRGGSAAASSNEVIVEVLSAGARVAAACPAPSSSRSTRGAARAPSRSCAPAGSSTCWCRAGERTSSAPSCASRPCPSSRPASATCTSTSTRAPTWPSRCRSCSTPRPSASGVCNAAETLLVHQARGRRVPARRDRDARRRGRHDPRRRRDARARARGGRRRRRPPTRTGPPSTCRSTSPCASSTTSTRRSSTSATWSSGHTEAIITRDLASSERFVAEVDSAAVMVNASTRFTDGGQLGLGAEIGISTQKLHARGPDGPGRAHDDQVDRARRRARPALTAQPTVRHWSPPAPPLEEVTCTLP